MKYKDIRLIPVYQSEEIIKYIAYSEDNIDYLTDSINDTAIEAQEILKLDLDIVLEGIYDNVYSLANKSTTRITKDDADSQDDLVNLKQLVEQQKLLASHIFSGDIERVETLFQTMMTYLDGIELEVQRGLIQYLFNDIDKQLFDIGLYDAFKDIQSSNEEIRSLKDSREIYNWGISKLKGIIHNIQLNSKGSENVVIDRAKEYINDNYHTDISLEDVANHVFLSPAYFSRIFKKYCDENFSEYLLKLRINKATILLRNTQLKVYEIAEKSGFKTVKYFYKLFKQQTGLTPTEYRLSILEKRETYHHE